MRASFPKFSATHIIVVDFFVGRLYVSSHRPEGEPAMTRDEMDRATIGLPTKSAKIRALDKIGVTRSEIANYLNIRYQHVRNVLIGPAPSHQNGTDRGNPSLSPIANDTLPEVLPLSIDEAKRGLAARFGVSPNAVEIKIRG
jgi:hypothetical protein